MDRHRLPFLLSPHGHHQRAMLYHPRPRHHLGMPSLPIYDGLLSPSNHHSSSMSFPRPYPEDYPPFLAGPGPGPYGMMGPYPMPIDYGYRFPGGYPPLPIPRLSSHGSFLDYRNPTDGAVQYQSHMDALQDHMNSFLGLTSPPDSGKPIHSHGDEPLDWKSIESSFLGREGSTSDDISALRLPALPRLRAVGNRPVDRFASPPRRGSLSGWHTALTPPPLQLPSGPINRPKLEPDLKNRKKTSGAGYTSQNGVLSGERIDEIFNEHYVAKIPKLPPLVVGNKDLAKRLNAENCDVLNLSRSSGKSRTRRRMMSISPECGDRGRTMSLERRAWDPADGGRGSLKRNRSPSGGGFARDLSMSEETTRGDFQHPNGHHPPFPPKSPNRLHPTAPTHPPQHPSVMTDIEAMRNAYGMYPRDGSLSSTAGRSESESSVGFSPGLLPPPPPLGFRGKGCFGVKRRRPVSPLGVARSDASFRTECGRMWEWSGEKESGDLPRGPMVKNFMGDAEGRDGSDLYPHGHITVPSNNVREAPTEPAPTLIRIKEEPIDINPFTPNVNDVLNSHQMIGSFCSDEGHPLALSMDPRDIDDRPRTYDHDQTQLQEDTNSFSNVPFVDSTVGVLSPAFEPSGNPGFRIPPEKRPSDGKGEDGTTEFRCHLCNYCGRSQHCLDKHFRAHSQACKICRYCLKAFERPSDLVRHEERHQKRNHMLATTVRDRPAQSSRFAIPGKRVKRRHPWTCRQCHFTCREARRMIQHTRRAHPIFVECPTCRERFASEAEVATHRAECHPVAVGRIDTYHRGVLTATRLVSCGVVGENEICVDFSELSELPSDCSGIPLVSNVRDVQSILGKEFLEDPGSVQGPGTVGCSDPEPHVGEQSQFEPVGIHPLPQSLRSPIGCFYPKAVSPKNLVELINIDVDEAFVGPYPELTSTPISLTIPLTVVGETCQSPPVCGISSKDAQLEDVKPRTPSSVDSRNVCEKSPIESLRQAHLSREAAFRLPPQDALLVSNRSRSGDSPKFRAASHQKPSLLSKLLAKPGSEKPSVQHANKRVLETGERVIDGTISALDDDNVVSTDPDMDRIDAAEKGVTEKITTTIPVKISKKEQTVLKKVRSSDALPKPEISASEEGIGSRKVFAERNGVEKNSETYVCVRCKYSTTAKYKYQQHLKAHAGRFICKRCNKACIKSSDLYRHWVTHNVKGPDGFFACDSCEFTSPQKYVVEDHMKTHYTLHPEQPRRPPGAMSRCGICRKNVLRSRLFEHKRVVHGKFFLQPRDPSTDANGNSLKGAPKVFACPQCDRRFTTPSYLLRHHFGHHRSSDGPGSLEGNTCGCRFCGVKFEDVDRLQEHEINHIVQTCSDAEYVKRRRKRKRTQSPIATPLSPGVETCPVATPLSLKPRKTCPVATPMSVKSSGNWPVSTPISVKPSGTSPIAIPVSIKHPSTSPGRRRLGCPHCKKTFKVQYFLDQHLRVHSGERPFVCTQCGAGFAIFQLLNIHRRFKCPHRKNTTPLLNSCSLTQPSDTLGDAASGSDLNCSDVGEQKELESAVDSFERSVEVSC